ncbi:protocadherin Fat 1-like [Dreissena polymorpha]|uniref:protocadherin Fat 1-like n=1 Tax=Dreissena polymorpha TaxID=45954 RepID=UPI0022640562|nr:protocadherin Fat 1-like [Dreissena polymorpha]
MDAEGDSLNYTCTVDNSNNPLTCFVASNSYPSIINLPFVKHVPEDSVIGTVLFTPEVEDIDLPVEPKTFDMTVLPASASGYFSLDKSTGSVILSKKLDYESLQKYSVLMRVHDTYLRSQSSKVLVINVTDVNEPNRISAKFTTKTFKETKKRGTKFDFELECSDEDFYDQQTLTIVSGTYKDYFSLNNSDRKIYLEKVWDLEDPVTRLPSSTMITVQCEDSANHTAIEYLEFVIEDVREQRPDISYALPSGESTLILQINSSTPLALVLLTVTVHLNANERDIFSFGIIGNGLGRKYFRMERVYPRKRSTDTVQAQLKLRQPMKLNYHKSFSFNIKVSDGGTPPLISAIPMSVNYTADAHVPKEADINKCVTCSHTGRSLIGMLVVECLIIAGLFVHGLVAMGIICKSNNRLKKLFSKAGKKIYKGRWKITSNPAKTRFKPRNQGLNAGGSRSKPDSAIPSSSSSSLEGEEEVSGSRRADHVARHKFHAKRYTTGMDWGPSTSTGLPRPIYSQDVTGETEPEGIGRTLAQIVRERRKVRKEESIIISRVLGRKKSSGGDSRSKLAFGLPIKNVTSSGALPGGIYAGREGYET